MSWKKKSTHAGFTVLEVVFALALLSIIAMKVASVMGRVQDVSATGTAESVLQDRAQVTLERIARAVMGSNRESLIPDAEEPMSSSELQFQVNLGLDNGEIVWSEPEKIWLEDETPSVFWARNPGEPSKQSVAWTNLAREFLEGELPNGMDDNGNGLIDEKGLSFTVDRNAVRIRLSLENRNEEGETLTYTVETTVTCRNLEVSE